MTVCTFPVQAGLLKAIEDFVSSDHRCCNRPQVQLSLLRSLNCPGLPGPVDGSRPMTQKTRGSERKEQARGKAAASAEGREANYSERGEAYSCLQLNEILFVLGSKWAKS